MVSSHFSVATEDSESLPGQITWYAFEVEAATKELELELKCYFLSTASR